MYEVLLYAAIATIICVMLYSVLGKSVGQGPDNPIDAKKELENFGVSNPGVVQPVVPTGPKTGLQKIAEIDASFSPSFFIDGAKAAYSMILEAYAAGDKDQLESLLTPDVYKVYSGAIDARNADNLKQVTDLGRLRSCAIKDSSLEGNLARISVLYKAELTSALMNSDGDVVQGDPDILSSVSEIWTFERHLKSNDQNWRLSEVEPSEGDSLEADPTPDTTA